MAPRTISVVRTLLEAGRTSRALRSTIVAAVLLVAVGCSHTAKDSLICRVEGLAGIAYGQPIDTASATVDEVTSVGVRYYAVQPTVDIAPFETMFVGVTPLSGRVFSIRLETHGDAESLDRNVALIKARLESRYPAIAWRLIDNHHYAERLSDLDLAIYRIGDFKAGRSTHLLSYDCDNRRFREIVFDEARSAGDRP